MSVLQRKELEDSPLADLHAIASELGLEAYRRLRREDLIGAILDAQGGERDVAVDTTGPAGEEEPELVDEEEPPEAEEPPFEAEEAEEPEVEDQAEPDVEPEPEVVVNGVLDILPNGSGFVRFDPAGQSRDDVYVSPAQIRRCELRAGDMVGGPVRAPRRNERHPSLVRVETVNDGTAEPPEERPSFSGLTPVFPTERLPAPSALESVPFGKGSRVAVGGPPGAGATTLLREVVNTLAQQPDLELAVVLVGVRPEEVTEWRRGLEVPISGGGFDRSIEGQVQAAELAVERAKRAVERGRDAVIVVDSLEALPPGAARRVFSSARKAEEGGSLTVIATTGMAWEPQRVATTRVMLEPPGQDGHPPRASEARSSTLRAELLS